jgi:SAM-dependent methyltransferase
VKDIKNSDKSNMDYHSFIFDNGELSGNFDDMYRLSSEIPWHQDNVSRRLDCRMLLEFIKGEGPFHSVFDVGCGLGYFAALLNKELQPKECIGFDISPTAVTKAGVAFPKITFKTLDIQLPLENPKLLFTPADLVVMRACFWYVFKNVNQVVDNLYEMTAVGGKLVVSQNFPPLNTNFVGKGVIPNPKTLIQYIQRRFLILSTNELVEMGDNVKK